MQPNWNVIHCLTRACSSGDWPRMLVLLCRCSQTGMFPILSHLNSKTNILGQSPLEQALVRQWITFQFGCIDKHDRKDTEVQLRKLNESLKNKGFIAGNTLTAADVLLYH